MCVTDLELDLDLDHGITEDEPAPSPGQPSPGQPSPGQPSPGQPGPGSLPGPDPQPVGGQAPGVAWGRAGLHPSAG
jgi:hypothetical protein